MHLLVLETSGVTRGPLARRSRCSKILLYQDDARLARMVRMQGGRGALVLLVENRSIWQEGATTCLLCPPNSYSPTVSLGFSVHG